MNGYTKISAPNPQEKIMIRFMVILGLISFSNFFYWFFNLNLIEESFLFWLLAFSITYEALKVFYIWYHYWSISVPGIPESRKNFTVDVFTTYFPGEPYEMVKETLLAIKKIKYPHTTYLCDEADDKYLKDFCKENDIIHITRYNRVDAKAGNINNALKQAKGDLCFILDPDHIPSEDFLDEVVHYFSDDRIGYVQTAQSYYNVKQSLVAEGAAQQTFHFYGPVMMGMNTYGTANAIGANCIFRRKALDSIGGHAAGLSEDMHTAMQLHAKGWKSVYVPKSLTKGLTPATLTSYYKQQLKWSRGTFELLVSTFPRLFNKFTFRQKLHYGVLPFHYLSGIVTLINILIPIVSLFTATTPWKGNMINFGLIFVPVLFSVIGIRFYVQKWLIHKSERGIHTIGGILQICTWWIYIIGFVYTIIRKKIPYLPTPKNDRETTIWTILIPNMISGIISIAAIIYGLSIDYTPFSIIMSFFALLNATFMFSTILFAYQKQKNLTFNCKLPRAKTFFISSAQEFGFSIIRNNVVIMLIVIIAFSALTLYDIEYVNKKGVLPSVDNNNVLSYVGIFSRTARKDKPVKNIEEKNIDIDGRSVNIAFLNHKWKETIDESEFEKTIDSIYAQKSIPMITWEPELEKLRSETNKSKPIFNLITDGLFDDYIKSYAKRLLAVEHPLFLRFAPEFDNPDKPWHDNSKQGNSNFINAWIHTYDLFQDVGANNVIWIWNPCKPENITSYYPGSQYLDWIGVSITNCTPLIKEKKRLEFDELYEPFHNEFIYHPTVPVIVSEFGTLIDDGDQIKWFEDAFSSIMNKYHEIKSVILISEEDYHTNQNITTNKEQDSAHVDNLYINNSIFFVDLPAYLYLPLKDINRNLNNAHRAKPPQLKDLRGINFKKGKNWRHDYHVLSRKNLEKDFEKLRNLGINIIKYMGNSVYDYNVLNISKEFDLSVSFGFWIPAYIDFINDTISTNRLKKEFLQTLLKYQDHSNITSWNIQNDVFNKQTYYFLKPELLYQNRAYLNWLKELLAEMKKIDPYRPIIVDLGLNANTINFAKTLNNYIESFDAIGLVVKDDRYLECVISDLEEAKINYIFSEINVEDLLKSEIFEPRKSFFITAWQDAHESNRITFNGLIDRDRRYRADYFILFNKINNQNLPVTKPKVKILKPAVPIYENRLYVYHAMLYDEIKGWTFAEENNDLTFTWSLIKCDQYGNYLALKNNIGKGAKLSLTIPKNYKYYKLLLTTTAGETITSTISTLNTPLRKITSYSN